MITPFPNYVLLAIRISSFDNCPYIRTYLFLLCFRKDIQLTLQKGHTAMIPSQQHPPPLSPAQQLQQLQSTIQRTRAELAQPQSLTKQVTDAQQSANQNNCALQEKLRAQNTSKWPPVKMKKPESFRGTGLITSLAVRIENYTRSSPPDQAFLIKASFLEGNSHERWIVHSQTDQGKSVNT